MKIKLNIFIQSTQPTSGLVRFSSWIGVPDADWMGDIKVLRTRVQAMTKKGLVFASIVKPFEKVS